MEKPSPATGTRFEPGNEDEKSLIEPVVETHPEHTRPEGLDPMTNGPFLDEVREEEAEARRQHRMEKAENPPEEEEEPKVLHSKLAGLNEPAPMAPVIVEDESEVSEPITEEEAAETLPDEEEAEDADDEEKSDS